MVEEEDSELDRIKTRKIREMLEKAQGKTVSKPLTVTDGNFREMLKIHPLMIVDCWAAWCGPCQMIAPVVEQLATEYAGQVAFGKLNVDENPQTSQEFCVRGIPTLLIMKEGKEVDRIVGVMPKPVIESKFKKYM